ncbi:unnamed protein product [Cylindrotheca closterium]|uniref:Uncharacterized protein n=1 Tax=Cylindrotheca closterium TaxID=2856 RepID=A0AAD2G5N8_9STRA|nr:unnamed protein product [Cylindrotheca closterium]
MLEFNMEMADAKDIDNGAMVTGTMDKLLEKDSQLEAAITEIEIKENLLVEQSRAALWKLNESPDSPPQPVAKVPLTQDRSESEGPMSAVKEPTLPSTPARAVKPSPLTAPLPSSPSPPKAISATVNQHLFAPLLLLPLRWNLWLRIKQQGLCQPRKIETVWTQALGSNTPSLASSRVSDNILDASPSSVFPIFRHPQHSPPSDHIEKRISETKQHANTQNQPICLA